MSEKKACEELAVSLDEATVEVEKDPYGDGTEYEIYVGAYYVVIPIVGGDV